jgi:hypothetical protein
MTRQELIEAFQVEVKRVLREQYHALGRNMAGYLHKAIAERGVVTALTNVVLVPTAGFQTLRDARRLDLVMEWLVIDPRWEALFSSEIRQVAHDRLRGAAA